MIVPRRSHGGVSFGTYAIAMVIIAGLAIAFTFVLIGIVLEGKP